MGMVAYFTSGVGVVGGVLCADADPADVYHGEFDALFDDTVDPDPVCANDDATCVTFPTLGLEDFVLVKTTQPDKGNEVGGGDFSFGTIIWMRCGGEVATVC